MQINVTESNDLYAYAHILRTLAMQRNAYRIEADGVSVEGLLIEAYVVRYGTPGEDGEKVDLVLRLWDEPTAYPEQTATVFAVDPANLTLTYL